MHRRVAVPEPARRALGLSGHGLPYAPRKGVVGEGDNCAIGALDLREQAVAVPRIAPRPAVGPFGGAQGRLRLPPRRPDLSCSLEMLS